MEFMPDNPIIRNCERTGWPDGKEPQSFYCPHCGAENPDSYFLDKFGYLCGCERCIRIVDAYEVDD